MSKVARALAAATLFAAPFFAQNYGRFIGNVKAEWGPDGRNMILLEPFAYVDPDGVRWDAPAKSVVDGASIPRFAWTIIGGPYEGKYRNASVIHDVACVEKKRPWRSVHRVFFLAMLAGGADRTQAKIMYAAVYHFGPRWAAFECPGQRTSCAQPTVVFPPPKNLTESDFERLKVEIARREEGAKERVGVPGPMSLEDIERYANK